MSDGFDKEAEREKLREKLSDDDEKREHTQRMSELLLKGATMTNRHCDDCGDPIFRHDGREFCPTCHTVDAADVQDGGPAERGADASESPETPRQPEAVDGSEAPPTSAGERSPTVGNSPSRSPRNGTAATDEPTDPTAGNSAPTAGASGDRSSPPTAASGASPAAAADSGSVADARASLTRSLHRFAVAAEETDDPRRARDHLQAAREAAEALAALDR